MASHIHDDGFHEIQLNGKQLVFLFMAATVVSVVIFLCGVLVGRGVRAERGMAATPVAVDPVADLRAGDLADRTVDTPAPVAGDPTEVAPPPPVDELSYFNRLDSNGPAPEHLKTAPTSPAAEAPPPTKVPARPAPQEPVPTTRKPDPEAPARAAAGPAPSAPAAAKGASSGGFTVQIAALRDGGEANAMAERLIAKGYGAYVVGPAGGAPRVYRVRVGRYSTRREAETVAAKLQREEQFTPWITR